MYNQAPENYECPFCSIGKNLEEPHSEFKFEYLVYRDKDITIFISRKQWPNNPGVALIIPNQHYENIFDIPDELLSKIQVLGKKVAFAMKDGYKCDAISTRQHNGTVGNQSVFHYHLQVIPRYENDELYVNHWKGFRIPHEKRVEYATILKTHFKP